MTPTDTLKATVLAYIQVHDDVSFAELVQDLAGRGIEVDGPQALVLRANENVVLWPSLSAPLVTAIRALLADEAITGSSEPAALHAGRPDGGSADCPARGPVQEPAMAAGGAAPGPARGA